MEDNQKKPGAAGGARDISDLKARLGLKKGPAAAGPAAAPPGLGATLQSPVPSPLGDGGGETGAEAGPAVDPRRDPFAAAAPAAPPAYYGYMPIPGVDDGKPVEQLNKPQPWSRIGLMALAVSVLSAGFFTLGKIQWARANMNHTIDQAADIKVEVDRMSKKLNEINEKVASSQEAAKNNPDVALAGDLATLDLKKPDTDKIFKTNYYYLDDLSVDLLFTYYNDTLKLYEAIANHAKRSEADKEAIENFLKNAKAGSDKNYGVTVDTTSPIPKAHLAEVNGIACPKEGETDCPPDVLKLKFRSETGGQWFTKPVKGQLAQVIIPLEKTTLSAQVMSGSPDILAAKDALRRQNDIRILTAKLMGEQKELLSKLELAADRKRKVNEYLVY